MLNILCPVCRAETPKLIPQFQRTGENKASYDAIKSYNDESEGRYNTSYILIVDFSRFLIAYLRRLFNTNDHRYDRHRSTAAALVCLSTIGFILFVLPQSATSVLGDMCYYYILIVLVRSMFRNHNSRQAEEVSEADASQEIYNNNNQEVDDFGVDNERREDPRNLV
jgi:hypothetical protein